MSCMSLPVPILKKNIPVDAQTTKIFKYKQVTVLVLDATGGNNGSPANQISLGKTTAFNASQGLN